MHPIKHFKTVTKHRHAVILHAAKCGIFWQGLFHDISKYSPAEFIDGAKYWQGTRSPNEMERKVKGFSEAWMHHKGRNKHHFEYWTDYNPETHVMSPVEMPYNYLIEMFCDRVAASKIYMGKDYNNNAPLAYFMKAKKRRVIHPTTSLKLEYLLTMLAKEGEKKTFTFIKAHKNGFAVPDDFAEK